MPILTVVVPKPESGISAQLVATQMLLLRGVLPIIADPTRGSPSTPAEAQDRMLEFAIEEVLAHRNPQCSTAHRSAFLPCPHDRMPPLEHDRCSFTQPRGSCRPQNPRTGRPCERQLRCRADLRA